MLLGQDLSQALPLPNIPETMIRDEQFRKLAKRFADDLPGLEKALQWEIPGTYFTYYYAMRRHERQMMENAGR